VYPFNLNITPGNIAIGCVISGTVNYTVQHTYDDPFAANFTPAGATWFNHPTLASQAANNESNYAYPPRAVRVTVNSGTGSVTMTVIQAGVSGG
jgi:hypothetical protein